MALKPHCDGCDRILEPSAQASLSTGARTSVTDGKTCGVLITIGDVDHLCHECRKRVLNAAIQDIVIAEWWDPK